MNDNLQIWEEIFQKNEWGKYPPISLVRFMAKHFYNATNRNEVNVLELGFGPGANLWYLAREGFCVNGIDGSKTACKHAIDRLKSEHLEKQISNFLVGDYYELLERFADESFDAIIDVESLCCNSYSRTKQVIELAFNKLKSGGKMLSITFADGTWGFEGEEIEYHAVLPTEGPLSNEGFNRYTTKSDIAKLYKLPCNNIINIERQELHRSDKNIIKEWIIEIEKN